MKNKILNQDTWTSNLSFATRPLSKSVPRIGGFSLWKGGEGSGKNAAGHLSQVERIPKTSGPPSSIPIPHLFPFAFYCPFITLSLLAAAPEFPPFISAAIPFVRGPTYCLSWQKHREQPCQSHGSLPHTPTHPTPSYNTGFLRNLPTPLLRNLR